MMKSSADETQSAAQPGFDAATRTPLIRTGRSPLKWGGVAASLLAFPSCALADVSTLSAAPVPPHDLSPWSMFMTTHVVVKLVMLSLAFASLVTWTILLGKTFELAHAMRGQRRAFAIIDEARSLNEAIQSIEGGGSAQKLIQAARLEIDRSVHALDDRDGLKERIASRLERMEAAMGRRMARGTGVLATIGATAPFVGLFGTVWGIMSSFIGISRAQTMSLAVVAPGIAEALLATAVGLFAAIPAVVIYNLFARQIAAYKALIADTSAAVLRLISLELSARLSEPSLRIVAE